MFKTAWKTDDGSPVSPGQCSCTHLVCGCNCCCACLWLWTCWSPSVFSWFSTIWIFSVPWHEKTNLAGKQYRTDDEVISAVEQFFEDQDERYTTGILALQHRWTKGVDRRGEIMLKNNPHLVKFDHCIIVSLWIIQPTLVQPLNTWHSIWKLMQEERSRDRLTAEPKTGAGKIIL